MDLLEQLLDAYEVEWGHRPDRHSTDYKIVVAIADTVAAWDDPLGGFASWARALRNASGAA